MRPRLALWIQETGRQLSHPGKRRWHLRRWGGDGVGARSGRIWGLGTIWEVKVAGLGHGVCRVVSGRDLSGVTPGRRDGVGVVAAPAWRRMSWDRDDDGCDGVGQGDSGWLAWRNERFLIGAHST